jgi:divalent metal cation (Fe/Co/Zn/Cd) transporter
MIWCFLKNHEILDQKSKLTLYKWASILALVTIFYNLGEGVFSVAFGLEGETLSLFGFGLDSFVEVLSGVGIWHMIRRLRQNQNTNPDKFEQRALRITGTAFFILAAGLVATSVFNIYRGNKPATTSWGIIVALVSIFTMWALIHYKKKVGKQLNSEAILEDANCTKVCLYLSFVLLVASTGYELIGIGGIDSVGAILIAVFAFREGRESFEKSRGRVSCCV